jgi:hypothetical protein
MCKVGKALVLKAKQENWHYPVLPLKALQRFVVLRAAAITANQTHIWL